MNNEEQIKLLERRLKREKNARKQAENLLETKSLELYKANTDLQALADSQEDLIVSRTKELKIARDKALSASEAKSHFLATMSHEIRTPMNGVTGMAQLLLGTELSPKQRRQMSVLLSSSESLLQIINDVLDLSKLESGKIECQKQAFDINILVDDILNSLALTSAEKKLELINIIDSSIPNKLIGDPSRLRQILINLLGNAIKFTHAGYVLLKLTLVKNQSDTDITKNQITIKFEIKDTGKGIAEADLEKLFKPFSQISNNNSGTKLEQGTGLGLSICKKLTSVMQGEIGVNSEENSGTTFWLELPFTLPENLSLKERSSSKQQARSPLPQIYFYQRLLNIRLLMSEQLNNVSHYIKAASNLQQLFEHVEHNKHDHDEDNNEGHNENNYEDKDLIIIDSENINKREYQQLIDYLETHKINNKQWIFIQSINETQQRLSRYCETNNITTIIKPLSQIKLAKAIYPAQFKDEKFNKAVDEKAFIGTKLLLAEDNKINQMVTKALLNKQGIEVIVANDGIEALEHYQKQSFDIIFLDINMPRMGGLEALEKLHEIMDANPNNHRPPIIALTANALEGAKEEYIASGMDGYLAKPIESDKLNQELKKWL